MNFLTLSALVHDKESSFRYLQENGIVHRERRCDKNHIMTLSLTQRQDRWRCQQGQCKQDIPVRRGTWLEGSRLTYRQIILFIYCWSKEMTSLSFCNFELEMNESTTIDWNNYLREVCAHTLILNPVVIGGPGKTVEIDESMFARRKSEVGRVLPQQWVFGGICRETRECFMYTVPDRKATTLIPIIAANILPGTTVISDQWRVYNNVGQLPGLRHLTVNHSLNFVDPNSGAHTQRIERSWKTAKERNKRHNGTHRSMLDSYMCEYMWRNRTKVRSQNAFDTILQDIVVFWPPAN